MTDFLKQMAKASADRAAAVPRFGDAHFDAPVVPLALGRFDVIAEIKERSPAEGLLATNAVRRHEQAQQYALGGAAAISVLTEPTRFDGDLAHLREIVTAVPGTPVMRKDFLVDAAQVQEARAAGASGVLLIVTMLSDAALRSMLDCAYEHGMFVLLEMFDEQDIARLRTRLLPADAERAANGSLLFGVNTRDLRTLSVDAGRLAKLAGKLPNGRCVAESGLKNAEDAKAAARLGYSVALVGTALMRSGDPAGLVAAMKSAGQEALAA